MLYEHIEWALMYKQTHRLLTFTGLNTRLDKFDLSHDGFVYCESADGNFFICCYCGVRHLSSELPHHMCEGQYYLFRTFLGLDTNLDTLGLSRDGFFYSEGAFTCFYCRASYPCSKRPNHNCPYARSNIPIPEDELSYLRYAFGRVNSVVVVPNSVPDYIISNNPIHRSMAILQTRRDSMKNKSSSWSVDHISDSGFFLDPTKPAVCVVCFYCDCMVHGDKFIKQLGGKYDIRILHVLQEHRCSYLIQTMGQEFIDFIKLSKNPLFLSFGNVVEEMGAQNKIVPQKKPAEKIECVICVDYEATVVFLPCNHLVTCIGCAYAFSHCCVCKRKVENWTRCYIS